jgi:hypothetical protein
MLPQLTLVIRFYKVYKNPYALLLCVDKELASIVHYLTFDDVSVELSEAVRHKNWINANRFFFWDSHWLEM